MLRLPPLYPITEPGTDLAEQVRRLGEAGFPLVQFRSKRMDPSLQWKALRQALATAEEAGGWPRIVVNDRADLAVKAATEGLAPWGLHLGQTDLPPSEARRLPGLANLHLGTSTHELSEWNEVDAACDHAGVGPFRGTASKEDHAQPLGLEGLREGCGALRKRGVAPVAIGGLSLADADACYEAGAESLAMIGEIARSAAPGELLWEAQLIRWRHQPPVVRGRSVVLAGGSGSGKSTLGRALALQANLPFKDLDEVIASSEGCTIPEIFARQGEAAFRGMEAHYAARLLDEPCVLALGGGAWETPAVREVVQEAGSAALWLAEVPNRAWSRVAGDPDRPLAQERRIFMERYRLRTPRWWDLPMVLPLGRCPETLAAAMLP